MKSTGKSKGGLPPIVEYKTAKQLKQALEERRTPKGKKK